MATTFITSSVTTSTAGAPVYTLANGDGVFIEQAALLGTSSPSGAPDARIPIFGQGSGMQVIVAGALYAEDVNAIRLLPPGSVGNGSHTVDVTLSGSIFSGDNAVFLSGTRNIVTIDGSVVGQNFEVLNDGEEAAISIGANGRVTGRDQGAIESSVDTNLANAGTLTSVINDAVRVGARSVVTNSGTITGELDGVQTGLDSLVDNSGSIVADVGYGVVMAGNNQTLLNSGSISSRVDDGVFLDGVDLAAGHRVLNTGMITGNDAGLYTGGNVFVVNEGVIAGDLEHGLQLNGERNTVINSGTITSRDDDGIFFNGTVAAGDHRLVNTGTISGDDTAIYVEGGITLVNHGEMFGSKSSAVQLVGDNQRVVNTGTIASDNSAGVLVNGDRADVSITNLGTINAFIDGIVASTTGSEGLFVNRGTIVSTDQDGIDLVGNGDDRVINSGLIVGADQAVELGGGDDVFNGTAGQTIGDVLGEGGNDLLMGGDFDDRLLGGGENDTLIGNGGADLLDGGSGFDYANYMTSAEAISIDLSLADNNGGSGDAAGDTLVAIEGVRGSTFDDTLLGNAGGNVLRGMGGDDFIRGEGGNDILVGDGGDDNVAGGSGNDTLFGSAGNDTLFGETGNDILEGGLGQDRMFGQSGADTFRFVKAADAVNGPNRDVIQDFQVGIDTLDLAGVDADSTAGGNQAFTFIAAAGFSGTAGELRKAGTLVQGDTDGNGVADFEIFLANSAAVTAADFVL